MELMAAFMVGVSVGSFFMHLLRREKIESLDREMRALRRTNIQLLGRVQQQRRGRND